MTRPAPSSQLFGTVLAERVQRLEQELRNREYEIDLLKEIGAAVVSELNIDKVFDFT